MKIFVKDPTEIRKRIITKGYTLRAFGKAAGLSHPSVVQVLNGTRNPSPTTAKKFCDALEGEFDDFFYIDDGCNSDQNTA